MTFTFQMFTETTFKLLCFIFIIFQKCFNEMLKTFSYRFFSLLLKRESVKEAT